MNSSRKRKATVSLSRTKVHPSAEKALSRVETHGGTMVNGGATQLGKDIVVAVGALAQKDEDKGYAEEEAIEREAAAVRAGKRKINRNSTFRSNFVLYIKLVHQLASPVESSFN